MSAFKPSNSTNRKETGGNSISQSACTKESEVGDGKEEVREERVREEEREEVREEEREEDDVEPLAGVKKEMRKEEVEGEEWEEAEGSEWRGNGLKERGGGKEEGNMRLPEVLRQVGFLPIGSGQNGAK